MGSLDAADKIRGGDFTNSLAKRIAGMAVRAGGLAGGAATAYFGSTQPANAGEDEFARQKQYGSAPKPASTSAASSRKTGSGMNKVMNRTPSTPTTTPTAPPVASKAIPTAPKAAPAPVATPKATPTTNKAGYFKGGSMGDTTVKSGQTLSGIAKSTGQSVADLAKMNNISDVNKISAGAKLMTKVPTPPSRPADTATSTPASASKPAETPATSAPAPTPPATPMRLPDNMGGSDMKSPTPAPAPEKKMKDAGTAAPTKTMAESVQVGNYKYRIV